MATPPLQPDVAETIAALLKGFRAYTHARTTEERLLLEQQILALFDSLGASDTQSIVLVREAFEEMRSLAPVGSTRARTIEDEARSFADSRIREFELTPSNPKLSGPARNMLRIPFSEATRRRGIFSEEQADRSFNLIFQSLRSQPTAEIEGDGKLRTSISVIRAFYNNFCNIPPFCSGKSE